MVVAEILSDNDFQSAKFNVLHLYEPGVDECDHFNLILNTLSEKSEYKDISFAKCSTKTVPKLLSKFEVSSVPTVVFFHSGRFVDKLTGADPINLNKKLQEILKLIHGTKQPLETRLKSLINSAPVMLFMKGTPQHPQCKFSVRIVSILNEVGAKYNSFNILEDEEVRAGLKTYSNWPTYPQLYVNGELIGGIDIVDELKNSGELENVLSTPENPKATSKLDDMLKSLINQSDIMLFIKGPRESPTCKFSKAAVKFLNDTGIPFGTYNVLENEDVRQGLKKYSDWPTYPQLYVKGKLIGGLDIMKELRKENKLISKLKGEE